MDHLKPEVRQILSLDTREKIRFLSTNKWIGYPKAMEIIQEMEDSLDHPPSHRMPNLIVTSPTNNGKTMIKKRFLKLHAADDNPDGNQAKIDVLSIGMPPRPDPRRFYMAILKQLFATFSPSDNLARLETQALSIMKNCGVKMLLIDDLHNMLAGRLESQRQFLNMLRTIGIELEASLVCFGTPPALRAIQIDDQLANRFIPYVLPVWKYGNDYRKLLNSYETLIPLEERSYLANDELAQYIHTKSEGTIGEAFSLINRAAKKAIRHKFSKIKPDVLNDCGYISPRDRRSAADKAY